MNSLEKTFQNKTVLITGHTGFKGSWLSLWLNQMGAKTIGVSDCIPSEPSNFISSGLSSFMIDYRLQLPDISGIKEIIYKHKPDFIFHLAAQALVKESYKEPTKTMISNAIGTASILESLIGYEDELVMVMITSDKVYDNVEWPWGYRETDNIGGKDPYSASKGMAELVIKSFVNSYFLGKESNLKLGIARAGNVIGGGDWAKDRIVPDSIIAASKGKNVTIRSPNSTRPWQHVLEPLSGYLLLAQELLNNNKLHGEAFNFGPKTEYNFTVLNLLEELSKNWNEVQQNVVEDSSLHEARLLKLNIDKALMDLNWLPTLDFETTVKFTADWYKNYYSLEAADMKDFSEKQIKDYISIAKKIGYAWAKEDG